MGNVYGDPPWTELWTDTPENITFPQLRWRTVKIPRFLLIPLNEILPRAETKPCIAVLFSPATCTSREMLYRTMCVQHVVNIGIFINCAARIWMTENSKIAPTSTMKLSAANPPTLSAASRRLEN